MMGRDVHHVAAGKDTRVGVSEAAHRCLDELDLMDGLADYVTAHRRGLAKLAAIAEPGLPREAMANYLTHAAAFLIRAYRALGLSGGAVRRWVGRRLRQEAGRG
jgi:hypothetical protein